MKTALLLLCLMGSLTTLHAMDPIHMERDDSRPVMPPAAGIVAVAAAPSKELLPPDAREIVSRCEKETAAIGKDAGKSIRDLRSRLVAALKKLQERYTRAAKLDEAVAIRDCIRTLRDADRQGRPDPGNLYAYNTYVGRIGFFHVTGANMGSLWGTDTYTTDSRLATAAVHSGALKMGQTGMVKVTILPDQIVYQGSTRHGITSSSYSSFTASYKVEAIHEKDESDLEDESCLPLLPLEGTTQRGFPPSTVLPSHPVGDYDGVPVPQSGDPSMSGAWAGQPVVDVPTAELPDDARQLVERFKTDIAAIQRSAHHKILRVRRAILAELKPLLSKYTREGELDAAVAIRDHIRALQEPLVQVLPDPGSLYNYASKPNGVFYFRITGRPGGTVWGTETYTLDSPLAAVAVHAGVVKEGQTRLVKVTMLPGRASYEGTTRNGITSRSYGSYSGSYKVELAEDEDPLNSPGKMESSASSASTELVRAIREIEEQARGQEFSQISVKVGKKALELIVRRGLPAFKNEECRYGKDAYPVKVEVRPDEIRVTESGSCIWKLTPVVDDGNIREVRVVYVPICAE